MVAIALQQGKVRRLMNELVLLLLVHSTHLLLKKVRTLLSQDIQQHLILLHLDFSIHIANPLNPAPTNPMRVNTNAELLVTKLYASQSGIYVNIL